MTWKRWGSLAIRVIAVVVVVFFAFKGLSVILRGGPESPKGYEVLVYHDNSRVGITVTTIGNSRRPGGIALAPDLGGTCISLYPEVGGIEYNIPGDQVTVVVNSTSQAFPVWREVAADSVALTALCYPDLGGHLDYKLVSFEKNGEFSKATLQDTFGED